MFTKPLFLQLSTVSALFGCLVLSGCMAQGGGASSVMVSSASLEPVSSMSSEGSSSSVASEASCSAPEGLQLTDIASVTDWINAMPKPLSLACFLRSLPRPIYYNATLSAFSAQPSVGERSPRVFFMIGDLILSVVPDEKWTDLVDENGRRLKDPVTGEVLKKWDIDGVQLLEISQQVPTDAPNAQSIKGEYKFPILVPLPPNAPFVKINFNAANSASVCKFCHADETQVDVIDGQPVYRSEMLRNRTESSVRLDFMLNQYATCDPSLSAPDAYRCDMLEAIYGQGLLVWKGFPSSWPTIFD